jgi:hypothetical protein
MAETSAGSVGSIQRQCLEIVATGVLGKNFSKIKPSIKPCSRQQEHTASNLYISASLVTAGKEIL